MPETVFRKVLLELDVMQLPQCDGWTEPWKGRTPCPQRRWDLSLHLHPGDTLRYRLTLAELVDVWFGPAACATGVSVQQWSSCSRRPLCVVSGLMHRNLFLPFPPSPPPLHVWFPVGFVVVMFHFST